MHDMLKYELFMKENDKKYYITYDFFISPFKLVDFDVYQIGRIICNDKTIYPDHKHDLWHELTVVTKGEGTIYTNGVPFKIKEGDIYISYKGDIHSIVSDQKNPLEYDFCAFYPKNNILEEYFSKMSLLIANEKNRIFHSSRIANLLSLGIEEMHNINNDFSLIMLNSIFWQLSVYTYRIISDTHNSNLGKIKNAEILCYQIMEYIDSNIENINSLEELGNAFNYSYSYLSRIFKKTTSETLVEYFVHKKLNLAKNLIDKGLSLEEIAERINYSSAFALSKAFKNKFHISPKEYKKRSNVP